MVLPPGQLTSPAVAAMSLDQRAIGHSLARLQGVATSGLARAERGAWSPAAPLPPPPPPPPPTALAPASTASPSRVIIERVGIDLPIRRGGQRTIDQGFVTWYDDGEGGWPAPTLPGRAGTFWLAAHRTSSGGPFVRLVDVGIGDRVDIVLVDGSVVSYRIESAEAVAADAGYTAIYGHDPAAVSIALQTSLPGHQRWVLRGQMI